MKTQAYKIVVSEPDKVAPAQFVFPGDHSDVVSGFVASVDGEEAIFVSDGIKNGLKMGFVPEKLLSHSQPSTGIKTAVSEIYFVQSAVFYRIFGKMQLFWIALKLFFDLKQQKIKFSEIGHLFKQAQKGKKAYANATKL